MSSSNFPGDSIFNFANDNSVFTQTQVTVTNHAAIGVGEFQKSNIVPDEIYAEENIDQPFKAFQPATYETTPGSNDGWWYDPDFEDWDYQIWGNNLNPSIPSGFDAEVFSSIFRKINGATLTGGLISPHSGGWPTQYNPNDGGKRIAYPAFSGQIAKPTWVSQCVTRNTGDAQGTPGAITFDRCDPSDSYVEFRNIGGPTFTASNPSLEDYNIATGGSESHASFFNGDEIFIQFELTVFKTYTGNSSNSYGYNYIKPRLQLFDGNTAVDSSRLVLVSPGYYQPNVSVQGGSQNDYAYLQNSTDSDGNLGGDFAYESSGGAQYRNDFTGGPNDVDYACVKNWPDGNGAHTFPDTSVALNFNISGNPTSFANSSNHGTLKIICGMCVKFRDPNQQDDYGHPIDYTNPIEEVKVIDDLRIRIDNTKPAQPTNPYHSSYSAKEFNNSSNTIYPFRHQLWEINNLKIKKGFGVVAPHVDEVQEVITFDNPDTGAVEQYTVAQLSDPNTALGQNAQLVNGQWVLNQAAITLAQNAGGNLSNIPASKVPAWVEVSHGGVNEWEFATSIGTGNGYNISGTPQWLTSKTGAWFGNNNIGSNTSDGGYTWRIPPSSPAANAQTHPFAKTSLGSNSLAAIGAGTPGTPASMTYPNIKSDYWRIGQVHTSANAAYPIHCQLSTGNHYNTNSWYFIDIEYADNASDNGNKDPNSMPDVGSYYSSNSGNNNTGGSGDPNDGMVFIPGVAIWNGSGGDVINGNGVGVLGGGSSQAHVVMVPTWRTEYGDNRWVLRAIYQVNPLSYIAQNNDLDVFSLRFYNFKNNTTFNPPDDMEGGIYVTNIISKKIDYINGTGVATDWDIDYNNGTYNQLHTFSDGVYNTGTDDFSNIYFYDQKLCWENVYTSSALMQGFDGIIPTTVSGQDPNWTLKFTVGPNPRNNSFTGGLGLRVTNSLGDNNTIANRFDGMKVSGISDTGTYEITFGMNGAEDGDSDWTIYKDGSTTQYSATLQAYPDDTSNASAKEQIAFYNNNGSVGLNANISGITLTNQTQLFEGGTVGSWNFDGFEPTIDDYIIWNGVTSTDGRIQFQNCPTFDPNSTTGITEIITANQLIDKPINRYEKYEVSFTYKIADIVDNPGKGLLLMYYYNNEGYGFKIGDIGDLGNPLTSGILNSSTDEGNGVRKVTKIVEIGSSEASSELASQNVEALLNTFVIRRDASDSDTVTGWVDNVSMKRHYTIELTQSEYPNQPNFVEDPLEAGQHVYPGTTVTFNEAAKGWVSFKSFVPEAGLSLSKKYFTLKDARLYQHYVPASNKTPETTDNYNVFYGEFKESSIVAVLNAEPSVIKTFNTLNYEGSQAHVTNPLSELDLFGNNKITPNNIKAWSQNYVDSSGVLRYPDVDGWRVTEVKTDLDSGNLQDFIKKEGKWFGYIKGKHITTSTLDTSRFSVQGIGFASNTTGQLILLSTGPGDP